MTYIELIKDFWKAHEERPFSATAIILYFRLLEESNRKRWRNPFVVPSSNLEETVNRSRKMLCQAREELRERGMIDFTAGNRKPTSFLLLKVGRNTPCSEGQNDPENDPKTDPQIEGQIDPVNTPGNTPQNDLGNVSQGNINEGGNVSQGNISGKANVSLGNISGKSNVSVGNISPPLNVSQGNINGVLNVSQGNINRDKCFQNVSQGNINTSFIDKDNKDYILSSETRATHAPRARNGALTEADVVENFIQRHPSRTEAFCMNRYIEISTFKKVAEEVLGLWVLEGWKLQVLPDGRGPYTTKSFLNWMERQVRSFRSDQKNLAATTLPKTREQQRSDMLQFGAESIRKAASGVQDPGFFEPPF